MQYDQSNGNYIRRLPTVEYRGVTFIFLWSQDVESDVFGVFF